MKTRSLMATVVAAAIASALLGPPTALATVRKATPAGGKTATGRIATIDPAVLRGVKMVKIGDAAGVSQDIKEQGGKGPNPADYVDLFSQFDLFTNPNDARNPDRLLSLNDRIYFDLNRDSGFYYYGPQGYSLEHDVDLGPLFRIRYGMVTGDEEATAGNVAVAFTLTGGWTKPDFELLKFLLNKYIEKEHLTPIRDLRPLPFHTCDFTFGAAASYGVPDDAVEVPVLSDIAGHMNVTITTDEQTVEGLKVALQDIQGLTGKIKLVAASGEAEGGGFAIPELPARVSLCDTVTYLRAPYVRNYPFENKHDFPVRLKSIYFLIETQDNVKLFEYDLNDTVLPPGKKAKLNHTRIHRDLADRAVRAWYEYRLVGEPEDKDDTEEVQQFQAYWDKVMKRLTVGAKKTLRTLAIEVFDEELFDQYGVAQLKVMVRSKHFDPNSKQVLRKTYKLNAETTEVTGDTLFFIEGEDQEGASWFDYKIYMYDTDGDIHKDKEWRAGEENDEEIFIGAGPFKQLIGEIEDDAESDAESSGEDDGENGDTD